MAEPEIRLVPSKGRIGDVVRVIGEDLDIKHASFDGKTIQLANDNFKVPQSRHGAVIVTSADDLGHSASAVFTVINEVPTVENAQLTIDEDKQVSVTLLAHDLNNDVLTYTISKAPASGTLVGFSAESATATYAPRPNYSGNDSFEFFASDGLDESARATVSISIVPVDDPPTVQSSSVDVDEGGTVGVTLQGSDPEGNELEFSISDEPEHGALSGTSPNLTYTPAPGYIGSDSFGFAAYDGSQYSGTATVSITVLAVNSPPSAAGVEVEAEEDEAVTIRLSATDPDSDDVSFDVHSAPSHGSLGSIEKTGPLTAAVTYNPQRNYYGTDIFTFTVNDREFESNAAAVEIDVESVNDAPEASSQNVAADAGEQVEITLRGTDIEGDDLDFLIVQGTSRGSLGSISSDDDSAVVTYTPDHDEDGQDSFTFRVSDGDLQSNTATVTIAIQAQPVEEEEIVTSQVQDQIVAEDSVASDTQLGEDIEEAASPPSSPQASPAVDSETPIEVPLPQARPDDVAQGAALKSLSTASVESTPASSPVVWLVPGALVGIASVVAFLGYREKSLVRGALVIPEKLFGLMARIGLIAPDQHLGRSADQPAFSGQMNRIYKILNDERCRAARKQIFDVQYSGIHADPKQYEASKSLAKKQFEQIGSILQSNPELQEPYFESFGEITVKVWWAIKEDVGLDGRKGMRWESLEWLGGETEKYWARQSRGSKTS